MKLVLFSDLHLDSAFAWAGVQGMAARRRRLALRETLARIATLAVQERADALLCAGDLYEHDRASPDTAAFLRDTFGDLAPLPVFLAPGNHDWLGPASLYARTDWSPNVHLFTKDRLTPAPLADGLTLWGAAHRAPANTDGFLDGFRVDRSGVHLALFHGSERGGFPVQDDGKVPHAPFSADQVPASGLHHAFVGHFHRPRDAATHTYPGNPDPLAFGEDGERGAVVVEVHSDGRITRARRRVAVTPAHDLEVDLSACASQSDVRAAVAEAVEDLEGVVRVTLVGELRPEIDLRLDDLRHAVEGPDAVLVRVGRITPAYDVESIAREPTVRGQFVRDVLAADLSDGERRRVLLTGLRALDGRDDLEVV